MSGAMRPPEPGEPRPRGEGETPQARIEEEVARAAEEASEVGREVAEGERPEVLEKGAVYERSRARTERLIRENRNFVADYMDSFIEGLAAMARTLEDEGRRDTASQLHRAVGELERTSERVRGDSLMRLARELEGRARERPMLAFGGAAVVGFALSRVLKSRPTGSTTEED
jgi:ElaB/YqjD/DUF883 family membrane-anchored ribosome-binding protein